MQVNLVTVLLFLQLIFIVTLKKEYQMQQKKKKNFFHIKISNIVFGTLKDHLKFKKKQKKKKIIF